MSNSLHSFVTGKKVKLHKKVCENKYFCNIIMPSKDTNQYQSIDKVQFPICSDLEYTIEKIEECKHSPEISYRGKVNEHISSGF